MKSFFNKLLSKVIVCPNCGQRSRVPIKPGKVLLIVCPACQNKFELKFEDPKSALKQAWTQRKSLGNTSQPNLQRFLPLLIGVTCLLLLQKCFVTPPTNSHKKSPQATQRYSAPQQPQVLDL